MNDKTYHQQTHIVNRLRTLIERIIAPSERLVDVQDRVEIRAFQATLLLLAVVTYVIATLDELVLQSGSGMVVYGENLDAAVGRIVALAFILLYFLCRFGYFQLACVGAGMISLVTIYINAGTSPENHIHIVYALTVPIIGSFIFPVRAFYALAVATIGMLLLYAFSHPEISLHSHGHLLLVTGIITCCAVYMKRRNPHAQAEMSDVAEPFSRLPLFAWRLGEDLKVKQIT